MVIAGLCEKDYTSIRICDLKFLTSYEKRLQKCSYLSIYEVMNGQRLRVLRDSASAKINKTHTQT